MGRVAKDGKQHHGLRQRPGRRGWYIEYRDADGRWVQRKAYDSKRESEMLLQKMQVRERERAEGLRSRIDNDRPIADLMQGFQEQGEARLRPRSLRRYLDGIEHVLATMPTARVVKDITPESIEGYLARRRAEASTRTCNIELAGLKRMLNWAVEARLTASNPIARVKPLPVTRVKNRRALDENEVDRLLQASPEPWRTIWATFVLSGLRHRELLELRWQDVDLEAGTFYVRPEVEKSKRGRLVTVPLGLIERLREMQGANGGEYVFDEPKGLRRKNLLLREFYGCLKKAGIARDGSVDIHALRYTYVTALLRRGVNLKVVQKLAGHSTLEMTLNIYAQVFRMDERDAAERLPWCKVFQPLSIQQAHGQVEPPSSSAATTAVA